MQSPSEQPSGGVNETGYFVSSVSTNLHFLDIVNSHVLLQPRNPPRVGATRQGCCLRLTDSAYAARHHLVPHTRHTQESAATHKQARCAHRRGDTTTRALSACLPRASTGPASPGRSNARRRSCSGCYLPHAREVVSPCRAVAAAYGATCGAAHLCMMLDVDPLCSPTPVRRSHRGRSLSCSWHDVRVRRHMMCIHAETHRRSAGCADPAICERIGARAADLDSYTRARSAGVAVVARQRASCAGADARVSRARTTKGAGMKTPQRERKR